MQFIPIVERTTEDFLPLANLGWGERPGLERPLYTQHGGLVTQRSVGAEQFGRFLIAIFRGGAEKRNFGPHWRASSVDISSSPGRGTRVVDPAHWNGLPDGHTQAVTASCTDHRG